MMVTLAYKNKTWIVKVFSKGKVAWIVYCKNSKDALAIVGQIKKGELPEEKKKFSSKTHAK